MNKITPLVKGIITGLLMVITSLAFYYAELAPGSPLHYSIYGIYGIGIVWTLVSYSRSSSFTGSFAGLFGQGFRCFIVTILIMVAFTAIFSIMHPEFAEEAAQQYREDLVKEGNRAPAQIEEIVAKAKKRYTTGIIYVTVFGYLIVGAIVNAIGSALCLLMRRN